MRRGRGRAGALLGGCLAALLGLSGTVTAAAEPAHLAGDFALRTSRAADDLTPSGPPAECDWLLAGTWSSDSIVTSGRLSGRTYHSSIQFRQFGNQLVGTQAEDTFTFFGRCSADTVELEIWRGWEQIGYQRGVVTPDGRSMVGTWSVWSPEVMEGQHTWLGRAQRSH
jgi:hypothetical protein